MSGVSPQRCGPQSNSRSAFSLMSAPASIRRASSFRSPLRAALWMGGSGGSFQSGFGRSRSSGGDDIVPFLVASCATREPAIRPNSAVHGAPASVTPHSTRFATWSGGNRTIQWRAETFIDTGATANPCSARFHRPTLASCLANSSVTTFAFSRFASAVQIPIRSVISSPVCCGPISSRPEKVRSPHGE